MHAGPVITAPATDTPCSALLSHSIPPTTPATVRPPSVLSHTHTEAQCSPTAHKRHTRVCTSITHDHPAALYAQCSSPSLHSTPPTTPATVRPPTVLSHTRAEAQCSHPASKQHTRVCISITHDHTAALHAPRSSPSLHSTPPTTPATVRPPSVLSHTQAGVECCHPAHKHHTRVCISVNHSHTAALYTPRPSPSLHSTPPTTPATVRPPGVLPHTHTEVQCCHTAHKHGTHVWISITHSHTAALYAPCSSPLLHSTPPTTPATVRPPSVLPYTHTQAQCSPTAHKHHTRVCISVTHSHTTALYIHSSSPSLHSIPPTTPATVRPPSVLPHTHAEVQCGPTTHKHHTRVCISITRSHTAPLHAPRHSPSLHSTPPTTPATVQRLGVLPHTRTEAQCSHPAHKHQICVCISITRCHTPALYIPRYSRSLHSTPPTTPATVRPSSVLSHTHAEAQ
jgi:hypothetical protein